MFVYADLHFSPFEGSPRAGVAEYVLGGMFSEERKRIKTNIL